MLKEGTKAPDFKLPDKDGNIVSLKDFKGKRIVLYFYPKDSTSGCTKEGISFKEAYTEILDQNAVVIGISKDSEKSHARFIEKNEFPFILLSDTELEAIKAYDVWQEKKMYGKTSMGVVRTTYVIDEKGVIEKVYDKKIKTDIHGQEVLNYLKGEAE